MNAAPHRTHPIARTRDVIFRNGLPAGAPDNVAQAAVRSRLALDDPRGAIRPEGVPEGVGQFAEEPGHDDGGLDAPARQLARGPGRDRVEPRRDGTVDRQIGRGTPAAALPTSQTTRPCDRCRMCGRIALMTRWAPRMPRSHIPDNIGSFV